jgi:hypothetical protein
MALLQYTYGAKEAGRRVGLSASSVRRIASGAQSGATAAERITRVEAGVRGSQERERRLEGRQTRSTARGRQYVGNARIKRQGPQTARWGSSPDLERIIDYLKDGPGLVAEDGQLSPIVYVENSPENGVDVWNVYIADETP